MRLRWPTFVALIGFSAVSHAVVVQVDPALFQPGTDISNAFGGVALSFVEIDEDGPLSPDSSGFMRPPLSYSPIFSAVCSPCRRDMEGQFVFAHETRPLKQDVQFEYADYIARYLTETPPTAAQYHGDALLAVFDQPTNFVQLIGGGASNGNYFKFDVWGVNGEHLADCFSSDGNANPACGATSLGPEEDGSKYPWSFTFNSGDALIGFITAGGYAGGQYVQSLSFNREVPEPSALGLFAIGLLGLRSRRANAIEHPSVRNRS